MKASAPSRPALFGERTPIAVVLLLLVTGVALGSWDATRWELVFARASIAAPPMRALPTTVAPTGPSPPATVSSDSPPPSQALAADPGKPTPQPAEPQDCPPLFPVTFALGSAAPQFDQGALVALVEWLHSHPEASLVVDGHSDSLGSTAINLALSERRAGQMVKRFVAAGLSLDRITRRAFGNYNPVLGTRGNAPQNRRVVLSVAGLKNCPESP